MSHIVKVRCVCGMPIPDPFSRYSGPVFYRHQRGRHLRPCRVVVTPDPDGHEHRVRNVEDAPSFEAALSDAIAEWRRAA